MKIDPNAPAYPSSAEAEAGMHGLTIRAEIAARVMAAVYANADRESVRLTAGESAYRAVEAADALITALNKEAV